MSGPHGSDPQQPDQAPNPSPSGSPWQQAGQDATWPAAGPAYPQYQQTVDPAYPQQYPAAPGYAQPEYPTQVAPGQFPGGAQVPAPGAYGQPGPYGQPVGYGQPAGYPGSGPYSQYPVQYPPAPEEVGKKNWDRKKLSVIGGSVGAALVLVIAVLGFLTPGFFVTTKLDATKAAAGVLQILSDETTGYGAKNAKDAKCNNGNDPVVKKGDSFECSVSIDGVAKKVTVTFLDDKGTYEVGRPQ